MFLKRQIVAMFSIFWITVISTLLLQLAFFGIHIDTLTFGFNKDVIDHIVGKAIAEKNESLLKSFLKKRAYLAAPGRQRKCFIYIISHVHR